MKVVLLGLGTLALLYVGLLAIGRSAESSSMETPACKAAVVRLNGYIAVNRREIREARTPADVQKLVRVWRFAGRAQVEDGVRQMTSICMRDRPAEEMMAFRRELMENVEAIDRSVMDLARLR